MNVIVLIIMLISVGLLVMVHKISSNEVTLLLAIANVVANIIVFIVLRNVLVNLIIEIVLAIVIMMLLHLEGVDYE